MNAKTADQVLLAARITNMDRSTGTYSHPTAKGTAVVTYDRTTRTYDVGTSAMSLGKGRRAEVLPVLHAILDGGCVTAEQVARYIANANIGAHWRAIAEVVGNDPDPLRGAGRRN